MSAEGTPAQPAAAPRHDSSTAGGRIANQIVEECRYLAPPANRNMTAGLHERGQTDAIDAFPASLATPLMREPSNAVAAARSVDGTD